MVLNITNGWTYSWINVMKNDLKIWVFALCYIVIAYLLYRTLLLINRKIKFSPSTAGADLLCIAVTLIYALAMVALSAYDILTKANFFLTVPVSLLLIGGCILFLYRKKRRTD